MRIVVIGSGGVGSAFATIVARHGSADRIVIADIDRRRAEAAAAHAGAGHVRAAQVDASDAAAVADLARSCRADLVLNACDPRLNPSVVDGALAARCHYLDMAMTLSEPHPTAPYERVGRPLGEAQFARHDSWVEAGLLALVGMGVEPGFSDVAARYASDHLFSTIDEIGVRDGSDLVVDGYDFAPTFSIWTTIEECLNPPVVYERARGWFTTAPFSDPEIFTFPRGIGPVSCVNVEHEEVYLIPRHIDADRVTFKYGLGEEFIDVLRTLHKLGLDSTEPVLVGSVEVSPRDVVAAALPDPATLGTTMRGRTCAGTWVRGLGTDGVRAEKYLYNVVDNEWSMSEYGHQAVVWQTAVMPAIAVELIADGEWSGSGVLGPEAFPPTPFLDRLARYGTGWDIADYRDLAPLDDHRT